MPMCATSSQHAEPGSGQPVVPFRQFLLKIHSRCNLACDYCYVYEAADQSWWGGPRRMTAATAERTGRLIAEHAARHGLREVTVVLHGGEPLLVGPDHLETLLGVLVDALEGVVTPRLVVQTNGLRLVEDPRLLPVLDRYGVRIGVSLDGTAASHDRHRRHHDGRGSHADTVRALKELADGPYRPLYTGLLCVIDMTADPVETYEALIECAPPLIDLLLPHATWQTPPPGLEKGTVRPEAPPPQGVYGRSTPYGDWLRTVFDRWYDAPRRETRIRLFEAIMAPMLGGRACSEAVGLTPVDLVVVETDGAIEQVDSLKVAYHGAPAAGLHVSQDTFDDAAAHPAFRARQLGLDGLGPVCRGCFRAPVCGGGLYTHRYDPEAEHPFSAPSVYCADLALLVDHIHRRLAPDAAKLLRVKGT
jgi:radical SAM/SPASM domain FxsB family protein